MGIGGDNLPSPVEIGLTDLPNIGGASGPPVPAPLDQGLLEFTYLEILVVLVQTVWIRHLQSPIL